MKPKRSIGNVRELPSGRFQARYRPYHGQHYARTFDDPETAQQWILTQRDAERAKQKAKHEAYWQSRQDGSQWDGAQ